MTNSKEKFCFGVISPPGWAIHPIRATHRGNGENQESAPRSLFLLYQSLEMSCQERTKHEGLEDKARRFGTGKGHKAWGQNKKGARVSTRLSHTISWDGS